MLKYDVFDVKLPDSNDAFRKIPPFLDEIVPVDMSHNGMALLLIGKSMEKYDISNNSFFQDLLLVINVYLIQLCRTFFSIYLCLMP